MIRMLPTGVTPVVPGELLNLAPVRDYLLTLERDVPGLDLTWDRAIAIGLLVTDASNDGRLDEHLAIAEQTFDADEFEALARAAQTYLDQFDS